MKETEIAWAAGFFDGEGTSGFHSKGLKKNGTQRRQLIVRIGQKTPALLDRFKLAVGNLGWITYRPGDDMWEWTITGRDKTAQVMWTLDPYLGEIKKQQFQQALEAMYVYAKLNPNGISGVKKEELRARTIL